MNLLFELKEKAVPDISGLSYISDFISSHEERALLQRTDAAPWLSDLKRRVQHYGYKYDYRAKTVSPDSYLGPLPTWVMPIVRRLNDQGFFPAMPDQVIVNEYLPGQGISAHIDCVPCFGEIIASLSLGGATTMQFSHSQTEEKDNIYLQPCSLIVLSGEARYAWHHAIPARKSDIVDGFKYPRARRVSLTFRNIVG